jgi:hypothetical protein
MHCLSRQVSWSSSREASVSPNHANSCHLFFNFLLRSQLCFCFVICIVKHLATSHRSTALIDLTVATSVWKQICNNSMTVNLRPFNVLHAHLHGLRSAAHSSTPSLWHTHTLTSSRLAQCRTLINSITVAHTHTPIFTACAVAHTHQLHRCGTHTHTDPTSTTPPRFIVTRGVLQPILSITVTH